ncbi:ATPase [Spirochaetia bacterium]|nr:ATPase [Spirochaetia bacterium]
MQIKRESYLSEIRPYMGAPFIKILTGIRRSGKSTILEMIRDELLASGVKGEDVVYLNLELESDTINTVRKFSNTVKSRIEGKEKTYLLLDEVQNLPGWERAVNTFFAGKRTEIFITGSNSKLLASEFATLLSGRYVQFTVRTLSFAEYRAFVQGFASFAGFVPNGEKNDSRDIDTCIWNYIRLGGFPAIHYFQDMNSDTIYKAVSDIFSTVVLKDVMQRNNIRNTDMLERLVRFLFDNVGRLFSARSIADYFKNQKRKVSVDTVLEYISALEAAYIIEKAQRFDIKGKKLLNVQEKYYIADVSFIHAILGYSDDRLAGVLENIVYTELRRRGYEVFVGEYEKFEIDFVCTRRSERLYVQVTYMINNDPKVMEREFGNLLKIPDQYPKYVVSLEKNRSASVEGVKHVYLPDFLLMDEY